MNLTRNQIVGIIMVVLGVLTTSTAQLNDLLGPHLAKDLVSIAGMINTALAGVVTLMSGQTTQIKDVQAMPGVEKIVVNSSANAALATLAVDPQQEKIEAQPSSEVAVQKTANVAANG